MKDIAKYRSIWDLFVIVLGVLYFRRTDAFTYPQMWAEDFPIFFQQYEQMGVRTLIVPYGGYLHFVPRLIAIFWGMLQTSYAQLPVAYNFSAFFITVLLSVHLWKSASYMGLNNKMAYALIFVFVPVWPDIFMTITNVHFITGLYLVNFLLTRYTGEWRGSYYLTLLLLLVVSLNGPISTVLSPLVVLVLFLERREMTMRKAAPLLVMLAGGIMQGICIKFIDPNFYRGFPGTTEPYHLLRLVTNNVHQLFFLNKVMDKASPLNLIICSVLFAAFLALLVWAWRRISAPRKYVLPVVAVLLMAAFMKTYWPNESLILAMENARYYYVPYTCMGWILIMGFDTRIKTWHLFVYLAFFLAHYEHMRFELPDRQWKQQLKEVEEGKRELMDINPEGMHFPLYKKPHK